MTFHKPENWKKPTEADAIRGQIIMTVMDCANEVNEGKHQGRAFIRRCAELSVAVEKLLEAYFKERLKEEFSAERDREP